MAIAAVKLLLVTSDCRTVTTAGARLSGKRSYWEIKTQIEERFTQRTFSAEKQCDQQTAKPSITVEKGMDRFELHVNESGLDERR